MHKIKIIITMCLINCVVFANDLSQHNQNIKLIKQFMQKNEVPGMAVIIYKNGEKQEYLYGYSDLKTKALIMKNTIFEIGSVTKTFTGLLLAQLITSNKINLNDRLTTIKGNKYIQDTSILSLATHTSGMPYYITRLPYNASSTKSNQDAFTMFLQNYKPLYVPQSKFYYSNIGFSLLAQEISNRENQTYNSLLQQNIFSQLGMNSSFLTVPKNDYNRYATGYTVDGKILRTPDAGILAGSWAIKSTISDMDLYLKANLYNGITSSMVNSIKHAQTGYFKFTTSTSCQGLGWSIKSLDSLSKAKPNGKYKIEPINVILIKHPVYNGHALIEKTGGTDGFRAYIATIPEEQSGVVILINKFTLNRDALIQLGHKLLLTKII